MGAGQQVQLRVLVEQPAGPPVSGRRDHRQPPQGAGQAGGLRVDHPRRDRFRVPVPARGRARQAGPDLVAQPGLQLGQAGRDPPPRAARPGGPRRLRPCRPRPCVPRRPAGRRRRGRPARPARSRTARPARARCRWPRSAAARARACTGTSATGRNTCTPGRPGRRRSGTGPSPTRRTAPRPGHLPRPRRSRTTGARGRPRRAARTRPAPGPARWPVLHRDDTPVTLSGATDKSGSHERSKWRLRPGRRSDQAGRTPGRAGAGPGDSGGKGWAGPGPPCTPSGADRCTTPVTAVTPAPGLSVAYALR